MANKKVTFGISGMTCGHCEKRIVSAVKKINGVVGASASFPQKKAEITFDTGRTSEAQIKKAIENEGYAVREAGRGQPLSKVLPVFLIILAAYFILKYAIGLDFFNLIPKIDSSISLAALFVTGIFTSVHCIAMCGGINLSQSVGREGGNAGGFKKPVLYNLGRIASYTAVGGVVGGLGSVLFISITAKGVIMLAAAIFMILMGLSMLGWLPSWLVPRLPKKMIVDANKAQKGRGPFVVGLLNGLLPCGPLQAMQLYALSTGSVLMGALSMFLFSLGTVPLMLGAGFIFSFLKGKFTRGITRVSAVLVILIALVMFTNAGGLFGWNAGSVFEGTAQAKSLTGQAEEQQSVQAAGGYQVAKIENGVQTVEATLGISGYPNIIVQKGIPVEYNLKADKSNINGCNATVVIPKFNVQQALQAGDNLFKFTPAQSGTLSYTCWMGMISGKIQVVDDLSALTSSPPQNSQSAQAAANISAGNSSNAQAGGYPAATITDGVQTVEATLGASGYPTVVVQKGIPVEYNLKADSRNINGCNGTVLIPDFNIEQALKTGDNIFKFTPTQSGAITYTCWMGMISGQIIVVDDLSNATSEDINSALQNSSGALGGGCCSAGSQATKFAGGKIPVDQVQVAQIANGEQDMTVTVNGEGYTPAVLVVQKGVKTKITFNTEALNSCNSVVAFPEYNGQLNLSAGQTSTPYLTPTADFTFQCGMGMLHGYVKVVDDLNNINLDQIKSEVSQYKAASSGMACCG